MDYRAATTDLIKSYNKYKLDLKVASFVKKACEYFDLIKHEQLSQSQIQFLYFIANEVGIPQYFDLLNQKFQGDKLELKNVSLMTLGAIISDSSLYFHGGVKLHKYQKIVLESFQVDELNRFVLSAPTSFGKTFLVYQIIERMNYQNIVLIFPTISLLFENFNRLLNSLQNDTFFSKYSIHTLSDDKTIGIRNIWIYTPERFLSFIDRNSSLRFDYIFIDEIYKIDNEYIIDNETTGENERDTAYRIALEYACRTTKDILLAGPYMEVPNVENTKGNNSFLNFILDKHFKIINYNEIEIVNKQLTVIKNKSNYEIDRIKVDLDISSIYSKVASIINSLTTKENNTIVYYCTKAGTERYAEKLMPLIDIKSIYSELDKSIFSSFTKHLESNFGSDWIVVQALKNRIGIHHGLIPKYIQKQIIEFFNSGQLVVLISTTTITEGVNTTAKNIIVCSNKKGKKILRHFDAMNIAGRAGRFQHHFTGRVIVVNNNFKDIYEGYEDILKHKNFDANSSKSQVDYLITDDKYLKSSEIVDRDNMYVEVDKRNISHQIIEQFKVVSIRDKVSIYDSISLLSQDELNNLSEFIRRVAAYTQITWDGFQSILNIIRPIVKDKKIKQLIDRHCKAENGEPNEYSVLTAKTHFYLKGGFFGMLEYNLKNKNINEAIRDTSDMIYNVFKYQLVKYIGVFDLMYKCVQSQKTGKLFDEIEGVSRLLKKLEYGAITENAQILSDYGVPYSIVKYYEENKLSHNKNFDDYEQYIDHKISVLLK